jgi:pimeloyl-ACP methyl ester carboxylesterase
MDMQPLPEAVLPPGITSRFVENINGLRMHVLEAGQPGRPVILLLHGFPELAYSWRRVMPGLAEAGYHVIAPDLRGYGRTTGCDASYDASLEPFAMLNLVRDIVALVFAFGHDHVAMLVGHDFGSNLAASCALARPDVFRTLALMSAPFGGAPGLPVPGPDVAIGPALAALSPPRKHYHWYYATRPADDDMRQCAQGLHACLRASYHHKSADWLGNTPFPLAAWSAAELAKLPTYYVMDLHETMAQTVAHEMPSAAQIDACAWLPEDALAVYVGEYERTGFQGGLNNYRARIAGLTPRDLATFAGLTIDVPSCFISGASDWGVFQRAGDFEKMQTTACTRMSAVHLVEGAGHWIQQERPDAVQMLLLEFLHAQGG